MLYILWFARRPNYEKEKNPKKKKRLTWKVTVPASVSVVQRMVKPEPSVSCFGFLFRRYSATAEVPGSQTGTEMPSYGEEVISSQLWTDRTSHMRTMCCFAAKNVMLLLFGRHESTFNSVSCVI